MIIQESLTRLGVEVESAPICGVTKRENCDLGRGRVATGVAPENIYRGTDCCLRNFCSCIEEQE